MNKPNWKALALGGGSVSVLLGVFTAYFEGSRLVPYEDPAIPGLWTNCEGNTHAVVPGKVMTPAECAYTDGKNRADALNQLRQAVGTGLSRNQESAFGDFIFNEGIGRFKESSMYRDIKAGNVLDACQDLMKYDMAGGHFYQGLLDRRKAEYTVCVTEVSDE